MEEEYNDVDWGESDDEDESQQQADDLQIDLENSPAKEKQPTSKPTQIKVVYSDSLCEIALERHQTECKRLLVHSLKVAKWSEDESVTCLMLSMLPNHIGINYLPNTLSTINEILGMFNTLFKVIPNDDVTTEEGRDGSNAHDLVNHVIAHRAGSAHQLVQLFYCLLKALKFEVRYVCTLDPDSSPLPQDHDDLYREAWDEAVAVLVNKQTSAALIKKKKGDNVLTMIKKNNLSNSSCPSSAKDAADASETVPVVSKFRARKPTKEVVSSAWVEVRLKMPRSVSSEQFADLTEADAEIDKIRNSNTPTPSFSELRWVHVDAIHRIVDQPQAVEQVVRRGIPVRYVVAVERDGGGGIPVDVTARYKHLYRHATARDKDARNLLTGWFQSTVMAMAHKNTRSLFRETDSSNVGDEWQWQSMEGIPGLSDVACSSSSSFVTSSSSQMGVIDLCGDDEAIVPIDVAVDSVDLTGDGIIPVDGMSSSRKKKRKAHSALDGEEQELSALQRVLPSLMPTRVADFKDHPVYLLERHLLLDEALHPAARSAPLIGVFRGETVHLQKFREKLRTRVQWRRELRSVVVGEEPVRTSTRKKISRGREEGAVSSSDDNIVQIRMFGSWQTQPMEIAAVEGGVIPMNEYGNLEIWDGGAQFVPLGAVFVADPSAIRAAKNLGLPHVPAVTGFENKGQFTIPLIGGVVVLREHEQLVLDATYFLDAVREESEYTKREALVCSRWRRLVVAALSRQGLRDRYGH